MKTKLILTGACALLIVVLTAICCGYLFIVQDALQAGIDGAYQSGYTDGLTVSPAPATVEVQTVYVPLEVVREIVIEKPVIERTFPEPFPDYETMQSWLDAHQIGVLLVGSGSVPKAQDCDDYAMRLVTQATRDGYQLWVCPVSDGYVWSDYVVNKPGLHVGCWTWIGNTIYYIEPTGNNRVTRLGTTRD